MIIRMVKRNGQYVRADPPRPFYRPSRGGRLMFFLVWIALASALLMGLWNLIIPNLFNLPAMTYFESVALLVLLRVIGFTLRTRPLFRHPRFNGRCRRVRAQGA